MCGDLDDDSDVDLADFARFAPAKHTANRSVRPPGCDEDTWLRADCDFLTERARFSFSTDGTRFTTMGPPFAMIFQLKTFQGVRYALFEYNARGATGGDADRVELRRQGAAAQGNR